MARCKRKDKPTINYSQAVERVAIAGLAALAARGNETGAAVAVVGVVLLVAVVEELGRKWIWRGKKISLRDVALGSVGELRLRYPARRGRHKASRRRSRARTRYSVGAAGVAVTLQRENKN